MPPVSIPADQLRPAEPTALVIAHPGHEIRVHAWLCQSRPEVCVLTDGSGHGERGRIASTATVLEDAGASPGPLFGRLTDRAAYRSILEHRLDDLQSITLELVDTLCRRRVRSLVSDAVEGMNPVHDLCFVIAQAAAAITTRRLPEPVGHYDFLLDAAPDAGLADDASSLRRRLSEDEMRRKLAAARGYEELRPEVDHALSTWGEDAFRVEVLRPVTPDRPLEDRLREPPSYEQHGRRRVAEGFYDQLLEYRRHFLPLAEAITRWGETA